MCADASGKISPWAHVLSLTEARGAKLGEMLAAGHIRLEGIATYG